MLKKLAFATLLSANAFAMHNAEINLNETDIEAAITLDAGQFNDAVDPDTTFFGFRFLKSDPASSNQTQINNYFEGNFHVQNTVGSLTDLQIGIGVKVAYSTFPGDRQFIAVPLGMNLSYALPTQDFVPLYLEGMVYYAPQVLSFSDAKNFFEYKVNFDIEPIDRARITMGYRRIDTRYTDIDVTLNESWFVGVKFKF